MLIIVTSKEDFKNAVNSKILPSTGGSCSNTSNCRTMNDLMDESFKLLHKLFNKDAKFQNAQLATVAPNLTENNVSKVVMIVENPFPKNKSKEENDLNLVFKSYF